MDYESIQIHLSSKYADSYNYGSYSDCNFSLTNIEVPLQHHIYISVVHAVIPYTWYNINSMNNTLSYAINGVQSLLIIEQGNYNAIQLASYLTTNIANNTTVTYNSITNKFKFTNVINTFTIYNNVTTTCLHILGLAGSSLSSFSASSMGPLSSMSSINLQTKHCVCVQSNFISGNINNSAKNAGTILCSIPVNGQPYSMLSYAPNKLIRTNIYNNSINLINLRLVDQMGNLVDLNGLDWTITLQIDSVKFV